MTSVAFIGLGNMGLPMAINLVKAGIHVTGTDLNELARTALRDAGGQIVDRAADAVREADVVITMLPNAEIVQHVYEGPDGIFNLVGKDTLLIDCSTIDVTTARGLAAVAKEGGLAMLDAPVSGGVTGAAAGTLAFMIGGDLAAVDAARSILDPMAGKIVHCGGPGNGQAAKVCNNMLLAISMIGVSEAFNLGRALGLEDQNFFDVAANASGQCWSLTSYCPVPGPVPSSPANRSYEPGFAVDLMVKDLRLALDALLATETHAPLGQQAAALYEALSAAGEGGRDFSAIIEFLARQPSRQPSRQPAS